MTETATANPAPKPSFATATSAFAAAMPGYEQRPQQTLMAEAIEALFAAGDPEDGMPGALAVQAGTGVGKSYGFLIPAAQSGKRTVIATKTIALQGQLIDKDLPRLAELMPDFPKFAILKGRANYACLAKIGENPEIEALAELKAELALPDAIGDRDSISVKISTEDWREVSATSAECPGASQCPLAAECFAQKAIAYASDAKIVVVNDAILGVDMMLKEASEGSASIIGDYELLVIDEADGLDGALRSTLTKQLTLRGLQTLAGSAQGFIQSHAKGRDRDKDTPEAVALLQAVSALTRILPRTANPDKPRDAAPEGAELPLAWFAENSDAIMTLIAALDNLSIRLRQVATEGPKESIRKRLLRAQAANSSDALRAAIRAEDDEMVRFNTWFKHPKSPDLFWTMEFCPVDISGICRDLLWANQKTVLCSATLTTAPGDFRFFTRTLGLEHAATLDVGTPFDYSTQAVLYTPPPRTETNPSGCPEPGEGQAWQSWIAAATYEMITSAGGGALLLYTSRKAMNAVYEMIAPRLRKDGLTVLIQDGQTSNAELARTFREDTDSVLFGLKSFFVGLDVPGNALRLVVIDKLPFPVPADYVIKARQAAEEKAGRNPFTSLFLPLMTMDLVQAFGRGVRSHTDRCAVAIMDCRLTSKRYGSKIVAGLPDCPAVADLADVDKFFQNA